MTEEIDTFENTIFTLSTTLSYSPDLENLHILLPPNLNEHQKGGQPISSDEKKILDFTHSHFKMDDVVKRSKLFTGTNIMKKLRILKKKLKTKDIIFSLFLPYFLYKFVYEHIFPILPLEQWSSVLEKPNLFKKIVIDSWNSNWMYAAQMCHSQLSNFYLDEVYNVFKTLVKDTKAIVLMSWFIIRSSIILSYKPVIVITKIILFTMQLFLSVLVGVISLKDFLAKLNPLNLFVPIVIWLLISFAILISLDSTTSTTVH